MTVDIWSPLSAAQTEIWLAQALDPTNANYNVGEVIDLPPDLDVPIFEQGLSRAVAETDALAVRFRLAARGPSQRVGCPPVWRLRIDDLERDPHSIDGVLADEMSTPFAIEGDCLFRARLLRRTDGRYAWSQIYHHIVMDGAGRAMFARRVAELYTAALQDRRPAPRLFGPLQTLLDDDERYRRSDAAMRDTAIWREELRGFETSFDAGAADGRADGFIRQSEWLSVEESAELRTFSKSAFEKGFPLRVWCDSSGVGLTS